MSDNGQHYDAGSHFCENNLLEIESWSNIINVQKQLFLSIYFREAIDKSSNRMRHIISSV